MFFTIFPILFIKYWTENHESVLYQPGFFKSRYYRIPAITTAKDGSLICATDMRWVNKNDLPAKISTTIRISPDEGLSWTDNQIISGPPRNEGDGDPSLVTDRKTGTIICLWNGENGFFGSTQQKPQHIYVSRSFDNGRTWEPKRDITSSIYSNLCTNCSEERYTWSGMFISSGAILQLRDGRILAAAVVRCWGQRRAYSVYSDDIGETWTASENPACKTADESKFFERNDGVVVISVRHKPSRIFAFSPDRGITWENETTMDDIWDSPCNGEVIRYTSTIDGYDKNRLLHTVTYVQDFPRRNVSVLISYDEGKTWPFKKTLRGDPQLLGSYSAISIGHSGLIHVYYEKGTSTTDPDSFNMTVHTFSLEWLTDGEDTYKKAENLKWCVCDDDNDCKNDCPDGFYQSTGQIFDQYVESYFEYPTNMHYVFPKGTERNFNVNLSVPGLKKATYVNKKVASKSGRPFISFVGINDLDNPDEASEKEFSIENFNANMNFDQVYHNRFVLKGSTVMTVMDGVIKVEVGTSMVRLTYSTSPYTSKSNTVDVEGSDATIEILNGLTDEKVPLDVCNGIEGVDGQQYAAVRLLITASKPNTKINIQGDWRTESGSKLITISSQGQNEGTSLVTPVENKNAFNFEGSQPEVTYINPEQTPTSLPEETEKVTKVPSFEPSIAPSTPSSGSSDGSSDSSNGEKNNTNLTLIIVAVVFACIAVVGIVIAVVFFMKMKKKSDDKSESNEVNEPLRAPLLF